MVWSADFKGWFRTGDGQRCDPLTISDAFSRMFLCCEIVAKPDLAHVRPAFERTFREYGLPDAVRTDNGPPFASVGAGGLSPLAIWWIKLGILPERIEPGHPEQNGRHERLHGTLKQQTAKPPAASPREALVGEPVGITERDDAWVVTFGPIALGLLRPKQDRLDRLPALIPTGPWIGRTLEQSVTYVPG